MKEFIKAFKVSLEKKRLAMILEQKSLHSRGRGANHPDEQKLCRYWDCQMTVKTNHTYCYDHYLDLQEGLIDECPGCGQAKDVQYQVCLECYHNPPVKPPSAKPTPPSLYRSTYQPEHSDAWDKGDSTAAEFFVYILKLDGGKFYAGQTRELRERLSEHRDGRVQSTASRNPQLVWFVVLSTREAVTTAEVELKELIDANPREIRRMIIKFRDLVRELDYS